MKNQMHCFIHSSYTTDLASSKFAPLTERDYVLEKERTVKNSKWISMRFLGLGEVEFLPFIV